MKKILISGATGYIGSHLAKSFLQEGIAVVAVIRKMRPGLPESDLFIPCLYGGSGASLHKIFQDHQIDAVFHLASQTESPATPEEMDGLIDANIKLGVHLVEAMLDSECRAFINTGTYWQYGEDGACRPMNLYAASKQGFQDILSWYCLDRGVRGISLQLHDVYGPGDPRRKLFTLLTEAAEQGRPFDMTAGQQKIHPVHVADVVAAYRTAYEVVSSKENAGLQVYHVAGEPVRLRDLVQKWIDFSGTGLKINWGALDYRPSQIMNPFRGTLLPGWAARISLEQGLKELFEK